MRFDKNKDSHLYEDYEMQLAYKAMSIKKRIMSAEHYYTNCLNACKERPLVNTQSIYECFNMLYLHGFNVDYACDSFVENAVANAKKIVSSLVEKSIYDLLGKCSGHLIYDTWHFTYSITEHVAYFTVNKRNASHSEKDKIMLLKPDFSIFSKGKNDIDLENEKNKALLIGIFILAFKKLGEVETVHVGAGVRRVIPINDDSVMVNKMPFQINVIDSSWLKTIVRAEGFSVRGHFRLQACGVGHSLRKLIYIKPFEKHGYVRTARKIVHERKAA